MAVPYWIEVVPHEQNGEAGVVVRTRDVCADGFRRGAFVSGGGTDAVELAVDMLEVQRRMGRYETLHINGGE